MPSYTSKKISFNAAEQFKESFFEQSPTIGYVFIGNHLSYANDDVADEITDTSVNEKLVWDNMYAARKVTGSEVELVVPRYDWSANTIYKHYDDRVEIANLIDTTANTKPMYVMNS